MHRIGLEQEFFIVNQDGSLANRADDLLERSWDLAAQDGRSPDDIAPEFVKSMLELKTPPVQTVQALTSEYLGILSVALKAAKDLGLRLYPLSTYPLHALPVMRDKPIYHLQTRTVGSEPFENAARCAGTHLHLELPIDSIDRDVVISYGTTEGDRSELLHLHNLATALDPALIALSRASPFYEGRVTGLAMRITHYRGSQRYGWPGVYQDLPAVGGLIPYAKTAEELVKMYFNRYHTWLHAMEQAGVEHSLFLDCGGEMLTAGWNPVRLNRLGTLELRCMDSNYPATVLSLVNLVVELANLVRSQALVVMPRPNQKRFERVGDHLWVPDFEFLSGELFYAAVTEGVNSSLVQDYLDSLLAILETDESANTLARFRHHFGSYHTTECQMLELFPTATEQLSRDEGLRLVRYACDRLEDQVKQFNLDNGYNVLGLEGEMAERRSHLIHNGGLTNAADIEKSLDDLLMTTR